MLVCGLYLGEYMGFLEKMALCLENSKLCLLSKLTTSGFNVLDFSSVLYCIVILLYFQLCCSLTQFVQMVSIFIYLLTVYIQCSMLYFLNVLHRPTALKLMSFECNGKSITAQYVSTELPCLFHVIIVELLSLVSQWKLCHLNLSV